MSINACSINEFTINTLCGRRRQAIIDSLLPPVVPPAQVGGGSQQHVNPNTTLPLNMFRRPESREDTIDVNTLELPYVTVTVEIQGQSFSQTIDRDDVIPMVNVSGLKLLGAGNEQVNITDIQIRIL